MLVRVDGLTYSFLGDVAPGLRNGTVNSTSITITPTQTVVAAQAGPMQVNLTFLNPIEVRFRSYVSFIVYIRVISSPKIWSSNPFHLRTWLSPQLPWMARAMLCRCIQMLVEVRAIVLRIPPFSPNFITEWNSGDRTQKILWDPTSNANVVFHTVTLQTQLKFTEVINQAEWGTLYYAMQAVSR